MSRCGDGELSDHPDWKTETTLGVQPSVLLRWPGSSLPHTFVRLGHVCHTMRSLDTLITMFLLLKNLLHK